MVITGPECSGKTTLGHRLTSSLDGSRRVPEYARIYLSLKSGRYTYEDLRLIATGQLYLEAANMVFVPPYLICDTSLLVIKIWSEVRFGKVDPWIENEFISRQYDLFILCKPDIPWEADIQRENPFDRWDLYRRYEYTLVSYKKPYLSVGGSLGNRIALVKDAIDVV